MSQSIVPPTAVEYPCSDGQPMAETSVHRRCMTYLIDALERHLRTGTRCPAYVSGNMFLYYEEGNPRAVVAPDVFVALGVPDRDRDTYLLWEESKGPDFVVEVTSHSTRREDQGRKREVYARLGVSEYFLYDPRAEYLNPPLRGFRLRGGVYHPLLARRSPEGAQTLRSEVLGLEFRDSRKEQLLRLHDPETGQDFLTYRESNEAREEEAVARRASEMRLGQESATRRALEDRVARLEARLRVLEGTDETPRESPE